MAEFRPLVISFILIGLFAVALINTIYFLQRDAGSSNTILNDDSLSSFKTVVEANITKSYGDSKNASDSTESSQVKLTTNFAFLDAINGVWKTIKAAPIAIYNSVIGLGATYIFTGTEGIIIVTAFATIIIITIIFAVWKMISQGEGG